ncbi:MAG: TonB family protein [Pseudomonadota bacterium]
MNIEPSTERLAVALIIATLIHAVVIYTIGFISPKTQQPNNRAMEIILVPKSIEPTPKKADYLAQINHEGSGENQEAEVQATTPTIAPQPTPNLTFTPPQTASAPTEQFQIMTTTEPAKHQIEPQKAATSPNEKSNTENTISLKASAAKIASIQAELNEKYNAYIKRPRLKHISATTKEYKYAHYMDAWRQKVEHIGNLNYPDKARSLQLSGNLILDVAIKFDGTIHKIEIKQASDYKILDEAALRIVHLAAPFDPFPEDIRKEIEVLHITRTWEFCYNSLTSK